MSDRTIRAVDLFCGSGGTSSGLVRACERMGRRVELTAVNHWPIAIETHAANHPWARHECARIDQLDPRSVAPKGRIDLLVASPECTHFSRARGGAPVNDQSRASGWDVLRWVERLCPRDVVLENVAEWESWGPVHATTGQPIESRRGETFQAFVGALASLGYRVEWRLLNAADYGEATTRERLFVRARRGRHAPRWPVPTHTETPGGMFDLGKPWRPAREIIDWKFPSRSIFGRRTPLKPKTLARIEEGIRRYWGAMAEPFLVILRGTGTARPVDLPVPTLTAGGEHVGVCEPFILAPLGIGRGNAPRAVSRPAPTCLASRGGGHLVEPFVVTPGGADLRAGRSTGEPLPTVTGTERFGVVEPFLVEAAHGNNPRRGDAENNRRVHDLGRPVGAIPTSNRFGIVEPFLLAQASLGAPRPVSKPSPTIVTDGAVSLVEPLLLSYYGTGGATRVEEPVPTVTTKDRFGLLEGARLDIRFRMLQPHELAAAMGFPAGYRFAGKRGDVVKQIGNAVCVGVADALCTAALQEVA